MKFCVDVSFCHSLQWGVCVCFRQLSIKDGQCFVPSQPTLEWICLKVLGAARLMSCTLRRCSRAFTYPSVSIDLRVNDVRMSSSEPSLTLVPSAGFPLTAARFRLSKQQMKWEEFVILNVVITSMLSRLWSARFLQHTCI